MLHSKLLSFILRSEQPFHSQVALEIVLDTYAHSTSNDTGTMANAEKCTAERVEVQRRGIVRGSERGEREAQWERHRDRQWSGTLAAALLWPFHLSSAPLPYTCSILVHAPTTGGQQPVRELESSMRHRVR